MNIRIIIVFFLAFYSITSCTYEVLPSPSQTFNAKDFPMKLGNYWEYYFQNVFNHTEDTIQATVVAQNVSISGVEDLWVVEWRGRDITPLDTQYVKYTDSEITFYNYSRSFDSLFIESQYLFPFKLNDEWGTENIQGTYSVQLDTMNSSHFGIDYGKGYYLQRRAKGGNNFSIHDNIMLVKGIGVVYRTINVTQGVPMRIQSYFLIDYHLE